MIRTVFAALFLFPFLQLSSAPAQQSSTSHALADSFQHPPDDCRIMMRWWWFGPSSTKPEITKELEQMKDAGIGGVEIATLYPLALDDSSTGFHNFKFLSDEHIENLRFAATEAKRLGLRIDVTLGSGWPFGGPHIPVSEAAGKLRIAVVDIPSGTRSVAVPDISAGEKLVAAFVAPGPKQQPSFDKAKQLSMSVENGRLAVPSDLTGLNIVVFFISSRSGMIVKRGAIGAEGFVLDHYDRNAIETHLRAVGDRFMEAFGETPPYAVFSDSLEDYGSDWTGDLLEQFRERRGYDLAPHLPALIADVGPETAAIRHDWGKTLTELANDRYMKPLHAWAHDHHTLLRSQTYGYPPVTLWSNQYEDLPEGEGKATLLMWRQFSDTRWAASAGHLLGKPVISSETWTWLHSPAFRATPLDMKAEADLHFLQGINQLVGHGWPYSPEVAGAPGWRMYAAGAFNAHNPWWFAMPELSRYLQRVSFALRQGKPANDVALLLPNDDAWAGFGVNPDSSGPVTTKLGFKTGGEDVSIDESMGKLLGTKVIPKILDAGFNLDFIDGDAIDSLGVKYPVLVLPGVERLPLGTYQKIEQYAQHGGVVIATRRLPSTAPGFLGAQDESQKIKEISQRLFRDHGAVGYFVENEDQLGAALAARLEPDVALSPKMPEVGFLHRHLTDGELYFVANTSNHNVTTRAAFRNRRKFAEWWDPFTGHISSTKATGEIELALQPYESRLVFFSDSAGKPSPQPKADSHPREIDLSRDWTVTFPEASHTIHMDALHSWTDEEALRYFSGRATYQKTVDLSEENIAGKSLLLDFGEGTVVAKPDPLPEFNLRAYLEGPVRDAAEVFVNGTSAGVVWHPPYVVDLTALVKPGKNELRIVVGNTAINTLAGRALPDYRLLNDRYGERFVPQGMENLQPLPSGIVGPLRLKIASMEATW